MKKILLLIVVLGLGAVGYSHFFRKPVGAKKVKSNNSFVAVERRTLRSIVSTTGRVIANLELQIKCKASGEVIKLPYDVSDEVKMDDLLVQLDPVDEDRSVRRAQVALNVTRARLEQARVNLEIAKSKLTTDRKRVQAAFVSADARAKEFSAKFKRSKELFKSKMVSREKYDSDRTAEITAAATLAEAQSRIEDLKSQKQAIDLKRQDIIIAKAQVETNALSLAEALQRLSETKVIAPMDGVIVSREVQVGQIISSGISNVGGGTTVLTIADLSRIFIVASVDESDIGRVQVDQDAIITADAYAGQRFRGTVVRIGAKGDNVSNVVTFEVTIEVQGRRRNMLKPEMTANIEIVAALREDALVLPVQAVLRRRRKQFVTIASAKGKGEDREIKVGISDGQVYEILSGLKEGEKVRISHGKEQSRWRRGGNEARNKRRATMMGARMMGAGRRKR